MENLNQKIRKSAVKYGLILGLVTTALSIIAFYTVTAPSISAILFIVAPILLRLFIPMIVVVALCFQVRKSVGGLWTFRQATTGIFIMLATAYVVEVLGKDLLFDKVIEPQGVEKTQQAAISTKIANMKSRSIAQAKIDASIADMKKDFAQKDTSTVGSVLVSNGYIVLFLFVFALIFASLLRNAVLVKAENNG